MSKPMEKGEKLDEAAKEKEFYSRKRLRTRKKVYSLIFFIHCINFKMYNKKDKIANTNTREGQLDCMVNFET